MRHGVLVLVEGEREVALVRAIDAPGTGLAVARRCADVAELLAAGAAGVGQVALVDGHAPGVDATLVARVEEGGVRVVVLADPVAEDRFPRAGAVVARGTAVEEVISSVVGVLGARVPGRADEAPPPPTGAGTEGPSADDPDDTTPVDRSWQADDLAELDAGRVRRGAVPAPLDGGSEDEEDADEGGEDGRLVVVWGTAGAPGRTTLAANLAVELAALAVGRPDPARHRRGARERHDPGGDRGDGRPMLLVDLDTEAPSLAQTLGMLEDSSTVAALARRASHGRATAAGVRRASPLLVPGLQVATGLSRADRWRELSEAALAELWPAMRRAAQVTVVDVGAGAEDPPPGLEAWGAPPRHGATRAALAQADVVLVVGSADPVGVRRLVEALGHLSEHSLAPRAEVLPVLTKVRASAAGADPAQACLEALDRYVQVDEAVIVPDDRPAFDRCLLEGRTLLEAAPSSPARAPLSALARWLLPVRVAA